MMLHIAELERKTDLAAKNPVFVALRFRTEARMKFGIDFVHANNANVVRKQSVRSPQQIAGRNWVLDTKRGHLRQGVNAGIGAAGTSYLHGLSFDFGYYLLERSSNAV